MADSRASGRGSEGSTLSRGTRHKRSSNVFTTMSRNSDLLSTAEIDISASHVIETHRDSKPDFVYVIKVSFKDAQWEIQKRYSDLHYFKERMAAYPDIKSTMKEFPAKIAGKANFDDANSKITEINIWLRDFLVTTRFQHGSLAEQQLFNFIELYLHQPVPQDRMMRISPDRVHHMGFLRKLGGNKSGGTGNWKRRYMVLQQDLRYYENEDIFRNGGLPKGIIKLNAFCIEVKPDGLLNEFVIHTMPHPLVCRAASHEEMAEWVDALQLVGEGERSVNRCRVAQPMKKEEEENEEESVDENENQEVIKWA